MAEAGYVKVGGKKIEGHFAVYSVGADKRDDSVRGAADALNYDIYPW